MMHTVSTLLLLAVVAEAQLPSRQTRHHDALTGNVQRFPDFFVKGHVRDGFLIRPQNQHHSALTGLGGDLPDLFVKGHVKDNFVLQPQAQHHDALTGLGSALPGQFVKGHTSDLVSGFAEDYSLRKTMNAGIASPSMIEEFAFCKVSGDQCSQYVLKREWMGLATTLGGFKAGTCWEHGYSVSEGSKDISMPLIGETKVRFFKAPEKEIPSMEAFAQTSPDIIRALALAFISLVGISVTIFGFFRVHRGTVMADKESLLASWNL